MCTASCGAEGGEVGSPSIGGYLVIRLVSVTQPLESGDTDGSVKCPGSGGGGRYKELDLGEG